ncbi:MAG TPA: PAS domain S-box protein, partial [Ignavibacteriaceae bacterium]|nr:PAS domain S-box protein [Ignavibacteriaceae bacterium]
MKDHDSNYQSDLRKKAEERLKHLSIDPHYLSEADVRKLAQDLQIYKVELEIQNEELRNTQSELQRSFSQFYELFNSAPVGYVVLDDVGIILKANQTFSTLTGLDTVALIHKPFTSLLNEEDADIFFSRYKAIHKKPEGKVLELKIKGNHNHFFYARLEGSIINLDIVKRTDDSNPYFLFAVSDITSEKIAQSELTKSESKFRQLFNFITDPIMLIKPVSESEGFGKVLEVNDIACERYGYTREEFLNLTLNDIDAPEVLGGVSQKIRTILESGTELWEGSHIKKDGSKIPVEIHVRTFNYNNETVILSSVRDISERKKAEAALKESENRFKNLVNSTDEIIFTLDTEMRHTGVYGPWVKTSGFTEEVF